eukprot:m.119169 g.119169  ORF g.119169 m.119169 type:complete len:164 (-) comp23162_c0_seq11:20-511(-)
MRLFVKTSHLKPLSHLPSLPAFFFYCKVVTPEQVAAYTSGKQDTLNRVFEMISPNGTVIAKGANPIHPPPFGGNMKFLKFDTTKKRCSFMLNLLDVIVLYFQSLDFVFCSFRENNDNSTPITTIAIRDNFTYSSFAHKHHTNKQTNNTIRLSTHSHASTQKHT